MLNRIRYYQRRAGTLLIVVLFLAPVTGFAQEETQEKVVKIETEIKLPDQIVPSQGTPKLGLYLENLDFEEAYRRHYPYNYGVLITGVVNGGNGQQAGLIKGDIIMEFNGEKVRFEDHLISLRDSRKIGETAQIKYFRNEQEHTTRLTFQAVTDLESNVDAITGKRKLSPGHGGGGFEPVLIMYDFQGINDYLLLNGFHEMNDGYVMAWGGGGAGNVGKGWFIGGKGAGMESKQQIRLADNSGYRKYKFEMGYGGVTLTKKVPLFTERLILDAGIMLGGGSLALQVSQTEGDFSWGDPLGGGISNSVKYLKPFFAYNPSVGLLVRIKNWVGIHGSVGYFGTYAGDDRWTDEMFEFTVEPPSGAKSPGLPSGLSYSLGFWFGN